MKVVTTKDTKITTENPRKGNPLIDCTSVVYFAILHDLLCKSRAAAVRGTNRMSLAVSE